LLFEVNNSEVKFGMLLIKKKLTSSDSKELNKFIFSISLRIDQDLIVSLEG